MRACASLDTLNLLEFMEITMRKRAALLLSLGVGIGLTTIGCSDWNSPPMPSVQDPETVIESSINRLTEEDRALAKRQKFCPIMEKERLGLREPPIKLLIEGKSVFVCCDSCVVPAQQNSKKTLDQVARLISENP